MSKIPTRAAAAPVKKEYERKDLPYVEDFGDELDGLEEISAMMREVVAREKAIQEEKAGLAAAALALITSVKADESWSIRTTDDDLWTYMKPPDRETLIKERLIEQGVTLAQIKKATKKTPVTPYVQFRAAKEKE